MAGALLGAWGPACWGDAPGDNQPFSTWLLPGARMAVAVGGPVGANRVLIMPYALDCAAPRAIGRCRVLEALQADDAGTAHYVTHSAETGAIRVIFDCHFIVQLHHYSVAVL